MNKCNNLFAKTLDESRYKWSLYNILIKAEGDNYFVYNTKSGNICSFPYNKYSKATENTIATISDAETLLRGGFIVEKNIDEFNALLKESSSFAEKRDRSDIEVTIAPSLICNMHCAYCFEKDKRYLLDDSVMSSETANATIDYILGLTKREGVKKLCLVWFGGEPMLQYPLIVRMTRDLLQRIRPEVGLNTKLITNGLLLSPKRVQELVAVCNLQSVQISIDGLKDRYSRIRNVKGDCYERVIDNIVFCCETIHTIVRLNATPDNLDELYKFVEILDQRVVDKKNLDVRLSEVMDYSRDSVIKVFPAGSFKTVYRAFATHLHSLGFPIDCYYTERFYPIGCKYFLYDNVAIDPKGNLYKCEHHFGELEYIIGDVFNGVRQDIGPMHIYTEDRIDIRCKKCELYPICKYASCSDYRAFIGDDINTCRCYTTQLESVVKDIKSNKRHLKIVKIE
ncbi:MAG: radical SAM protein [Bacteroidales bacterium]|nr:radical SAM protein [Bacteroidales bacterium]